MARFEEPVKKDKLRRSLIRIEELSLFPRMSHIFGTIPGNFRFSFGPLDSFATHAPYRIKSNRSLGHG